MICSPSSRTRHASPKNSATIRLRYSIANHIVWGSPSHSPGASTMSFGGSISSRGSGSSSDMKEPPDSGATASSPRPIARADSTPPRSGPPPHSPLGLLFPDPGVARQVARELPAPRARRGLIPSPLGVLGRIFPTHCPIPSFKGRAARVDAAKLCGRLPLIRLQRLSSLKLSAE